MATQLKWDQERRNQELRRFQGLWTEIAEEEFAGEFHEQYRLLCSNLSIDPVHGSMNEIKKHLREIHVNLVDLIDYRLGGRNGQPPTLFRTGEELKSYTESENKKLPIQNARAKLLRMLLKDFRD